MKKLTTLFLIVILFLTSCDKAEVSEPEPENDITAVKQPQDDEEPKIEETSEPENDTTAVKQPQEDEELEIEETPEPEYCDCLEKPCLQERIWGHTPPLSIHEISPAWQYPPPPFPREEHESVVAEFLKNFNNIYETTYIQWDTEWYTTLVFKSDIPLRDFKLVSLDVAGHYWTDNSELIIDTDEVLLTVPELLPNDAVILNVAFRHYLLPHGAIIYTDEQGTEWRMFIGQNMRGGCYPVFGLGSPHELIIY